MTVIYLQLTPHDPIIARDGRPFGIQQGQRMRGLSWPMPSVVAGSFRTALVKGAGRDFTADVPQRLLKIGVAGVFPVHGEELYLPAPCDAVAEPRSGGRGIETLHRVMPQENYGGCDFPNNLALRPVMLPMEVGEDFKPAEIPAWWPLTHYTQWLLGRSIGFDSSFLKAPRQEIRDHVRLDPGRGAADERMIFATAGLAVTHLPRFDVDADDTRIAFPDRFTEITLSTRVTIPEEEVKEKTALSPGDSFALWHPLGGERRLVHWQRHAGPVSGWTCPQPIRDALTSATRVRMVLATPAIFRHGWKPGWLTAGLQGTYAGVKLALVGVTSARWKAVSGWSLAPPRGPKPIRRTVPAGAVYFFEVEKPGDAAPLADAWLQSVSDDEQEQRDGFGLATWGIW